MNAEQLFDALGGIRDEYVVEAAPTDPASRRCTHWAAAVLIVILGMALFTQTAPGAAAMDFVREQAASLLETLFPPKELTVTVEGTPETEVCIPGGREPQQEGAVPGFAVYYDPDTYAMTEENGAFYIRAIPVTPTRDELRTANAALLEGLTEEEVRRTLDELLERQTAQLAALPKCELEVRHVPDTAPAETAEAVRLDMERQWASVSAPERYEPLSCVMFRADGGTAWDSSVERLYFAEDGQDGTWQLTVRYFAEAEEGHGARLTAILDTFQLIPEVSTARTD